MMSCLAISLCFSYARINWLVGFVDCKYSSNWKFFAIFHTFFFLFTLPFLWDSSYMNAGQHITVSQVRKAVLAVLAYLLSCGYFIIEGFEMRM
jgi:hypothetical protein